MFYFASPNLELSNCVRSTFLRIFEKQANCTSQINGCGWIQPNGQNSSFPGKFNCLKMAYWQFRYIAKRQQFNFNVLDIKCERNQLRIYFVMQLPIFICEWSSNFIFYLKPSQMFSQLLLPVYLAQKKIHCGRTDFFLKKVGNT